MTERLPTLGETPYKTVLDGYLLAAHNADGTLKTQTTDFALDNSHGVVIGDVRLSRSAAKTLNVDGMVKATGGLATITKAGVIADADITATGAAAAMDGLLGVNTAAGILQMRSGGNWLDFGRRVWINVLEHGAVKYATQAAATAGTDSTSAIQAAIDAAAAVGGALFIPAGFYKITSTIRLKNGMRILGVTSSDAVGSILVWVNAGTTSPFDTDSTTNLTGFGMEDIQVIDNRGAPGAPGTGVCFMLYCPTNNTYFRRVTTLYFRSDSWSLLTPSNGDPHCCFNAVFEQCFAIYGGGYGFRTDGDCTGTWICPDFNHMLSGGFYFANGTGGNQNNIVIQQMMWEGGPSPTTAIPITFDNMGAMSPVIIGPTFFGPVGATDAIQIKNGIGCYPTVIGAQGVNFTNLINDTANAVVYPFGRGTLIRDQLTVQQLVTRGPSALVDIYDTSGTANRRRFRMRINADRLVLDSRDDAAATVKDLAYFDHQSGLVTLPNGIGVTGPTYFGPAARDGSSLTVLDDSNAAAGVIQWLNNATNSGEMIHLAGGPNNTGSGGSGPSLMAMGVNYGGMGLFINNYLTGVGLKIVNRNTVTNSTAWGFLLSQNSNNSEGMYLSQETSTAKMPLKIVSAPIGAVGGAGAAAGQILSAWYRSQAATFDTLLAKVAVDEFAINLPLNVTGNVNVTGELTAQVLHSQAGGTYIDLYDTAGTANQRRFWMKQSSGSFLLLAKNDAGTTVATLLQIAQTGTMTFQDAANLSFGTTTGTKIGTSTSQKLGFFNAAPIVQPSAYTQTYATADKTHANPLSADLTGIASSTTGSALAEPSAAYTQVEMQQNFRRIQDQHNNLRADLLDVKQLVNSVIDDLQALGLAA